MSEWRIRDQAHGEARGGQEAVELLARIEAFLSAHNTLTLATVSRAGLPAAAAVFYAQDAVLNLYFLSEERSEHGQNLAARHEVAGTVQRDGQDWRAIAGVQVRGRAEIAPAGEWPHAAAVYGQKYAFVAGLLAGQAGPAALRGPLARARFCVLRPRWFRLIDNTIRFGHKEELEWADFEDLWRR